jgi:hypothetical protein
VFLIISLDCVNIKKLSPSIALINNNDSLYFNICDRTFYLLCYFKTLKLLIDTYTICILYKNGSAVGNKLFKVTRKKLKKSVKSDTNVKKTESHKQNYVNSQYKLIIRYSNT